MAANFDTVTAASRGRGAFPLAIAMTAIGVAACWVPAARAARIDPAITMRGQ